MHTSVMGKNSRILVFWTDIEFNDLMGSDQLHVPDQRKTAVTIHEQIYYRENITIPARAKGYRIVTGSILNNSEINRHIL